MHYINHTMSPNSANHSLDSTFFPHFQSTVVSVSTCAVPVAWHRFGVKGYYDAEVFRHSVQNIPANPKIVTDGNAFTWTNLELPLQPKKRTIESFCEHQHNYVIAKCNCNFSGISGRTRIFPRSVGKVREDAFVLNAD